MAASSSVPLWSAQQDGSGVDAGAEEGVGLDPFILPLPVVGLAVELVRDWRTREPFNLAEQSGLHVCDGLTKRGVLTRPIGNVIVIMPPFCTTQRQVKKIFAALHDSIDESLNKQ